MFNIKIIFFNSRINNKIYWNGSTKSHSNLKINLYEKLSLYDFGKFNKSFDININDKIKQDKIKINSFKHLLDKKQHDELMQLNKSINLILTHSAFYKVENDKLVFVVKTSSFNNYTYYCSEENVLKEGSVIKINEGGNSYLSDVKYFTELSLGEDLKNNKLFYSIRNNQKLIEHYGYQKEYLNKHIKIFEKLNKRVDISAIVKYKFNMFYYSYNKVRINYINNKINKKQWDKFIDENKEELNKVGLDVNKLKLLDMPPEL